MKKLNTIEFVDSLAEITGHHNKDVIERSLLKTLIDYTPDSEFRLYRVLANSNKTALALMSYAKNQVVDNLPHEIKETEFPDQFLLTIDEAIHSGKIKILNNFDNDHLSHMIYPAMNKNGQCYAVLIQTSNDIDFEIQRFIHALFKLYSNYLELIDKTKRDKLTQLLNRETLDAEITRILIRNNTEKNKLLKLTEYSYQDGRRPLNEGTYWLAIVDIDHFKNINDNYGHLYGDEVLILVARLLEQSIRDYDLAFRYGGEEFVMIMLSENLETADQGFERIRKVISQHPFANIDNLTVSIGYTQILNQIKPEDVIDQADSALYFGKNNGRNQVQYYTHLVEKGLVENLNEDNVEAGDIDFF